MALDQMELKAVLEEEITCLRSILDISQRTVDKFEKMSMSVIQEILGFRQEQIEKIQRLEERRKVLQVSTAGNALEPFIKQLSGMAAELVEVDQWIYEALESRKMGYLRQLSETGSSRQSGKWEQQRTMASGNRVDITQG